MVRELVNCPDCDNTLNADAPEFLGNGQMIRTIACSECDWAAIEEWNLTEVDVMDEDDY